MKGLLSKEFSESSSFIVITTFLSLIMAMVFTFSFTVSEEPPNGFFTSLYFAMLTLLLAITTFQSDEASKWNVFALTLPIDRKLLVQSKYLFLSLFFGVYVAISLFLAVIFEYFSLSFLWGHYDYRRHYAACACRFSTGGVSVGACPCVRHPHFSLYLFFCGDSALCPVLEQN